MVNNSRKEIVIFTGNMEYLRSYIMQQLLRHPLVDVVHCAAVRTQDNDLSSARLPQSAMVHMVSHVGDFGAPSLSLDEETVRNFAGKPTSSFTMAHGGPSMTVTTSSGQ